MYSKRTILVTIIVITLFIAAFLGIFALWFSSRQHSQLISTIPTVKPTPVLGITYPSDSGNKFMTMFQNSTTISANDNQVKEGLLKPLSGKSGIVKQTTEYTIYYRSVSHLFDAEIDTNNLEQAKQDAEHWLSSQGLTQDGVCKLPIEFYPSIQVKRDIDAQKTAITFNPIPDGC